MIRQESVELIRSLERVSSGDLAIRAENPRGERHLTGWLDLALVIRQYLVVPMGVTNAMADWKSRHPNHLLTGPTGAETPGSAIASYSLRHGKWRYCCPNPVD